MGLDSRFHRNDKITAINEFITFHYSLSTIHGACKLQRLKREAEMISEKIPTADAFTASLKSFPVPVLKIYPRSVCNQGGMAYAMGRTTEGRRLFVLGEPEDLQKDPFEGKLFSGTPALKVCGLSVQNGKCLMEVFPFTKPVSLRSHPVTVGTGDRLGLATPGHLRAIRPFNVRPVLAQQSVRENTQTGRDYVGVIQDAAWAVFQEHDDGGYGADGDHLKALDEVRVALEAGASMITLDLSEKLNFGAFRGSPGEIHAQATNEVVEGRYRALTDAFVGKEFAFQGAHGSFFIRFDQEALDRNLVLFHKALDFTEEVSRFIGSHGGARPIDFEVSIDETPFPTTPENHLFFIRDLIRRGVRADSVAPRFIGEFQKGIDYIGDLQAFRDQYYRHVLIARANGDYKISIHSGSDKFSAFPIMGELSEGRALHLKTAGTSWLEAVRLMAVREPSLYREMHRFALASFQEATKLYHVTTDLGRIPILETLGDADLPDLMEKVDSRQLLHITYGFLLNARSEQGHPLFRDRFFEALVRYEEDYWTLLERHIRRHLTTLGLKEKG
jgi:tagaturonate epimerase